MIPGLEFFEQQSAESGFQIPALEKVVRLGVLAADIGRHPLLKDALLLKGGTALNLCHPNLSRLSVDLDYNYIGALAREKMLNERPGIEDAVCQLAIRQGYRVRQSEDAFAGRKKYLRY